MSEVARRITGLGKAELRELDIRTAASRKDVFRVERVPPRCSVRLRAGMYVGVADLDAERAELDRPLKIRK